MRDDSWKSKARCKPAAKRGVVFHWDKAPHELQAKPAMDTCAACPVIDECLADMQAQGESYRFQVRAHTMWWAPDQASVVYLSNRRTP